MGNQIIMFAGTDRIKIEMAKQRLIKQYMQKIADSAPIQLNANKPVNKTNLEKMVSTFASKED